MARNSAVRGLAAGLIVLSIVSGGVTGLGGLGAAIAPIAGVQGALAQTQPVVKPVRPNRGKPTEPAPTPAPADPAAPGSAPGTTQPTAPGTTPGTPAAPASPAASPDPAKPAAEPEWGPIVVRERPRDLVTKVRVHLDSDDPRDVTEYRDPFSGERVVMPKATPFEFMTMGVVWPVLLNTASSITFRNDVKGTLLVGDKLADDTITLLRNYPGGTMLARLDAGDNSKPVYCRQVTMEIEIPVRSFRTVYDEAAAMKLDWPTAWPAQATSIMQPQLYLEQGIDRDGKIKPYETELVDQTLEKWYKQEGIKDPRALKPAALAKMITAKLWRDIGLNNNTMLNLRRTGEISGFNVRPAAWTLKEGRGNQIELATTLATMLRRAGLPTRLVLGHDTGGSDDKFLGKGSKSATLTAWVEFCLYDAKANTVNWVPVDIAKLMKSSSRPMDVSRAWKYFGTNPDLDRVVPLAFHLHPPTDVVAYGSPGIWGWFVTPMPPTRAEQAISFVTTLRPTRGGETKKEPGEKD